MDNKKRFVQCIQETCAQGPLVLDDEMGEVMCGSCGVVLIEKIATRDCYNNRVVNTDSKSRTGPNLKLSFDDMGLSTIINTYNVDSSGKHLSSKTRNEFQRLRKWDQRSKVKNRKFLEPFVILDAMKSKLGLPEIVVENAAYIYRKAVIHDLVKGRKKSTLISAAVYASCRLNNTPRTLSDIVKTSGVSKKLLQKTYRQIVNGLDLNLPIYTPIDFITRLASAMNVSEKIRLDAISFLDQAQKMEIITGRDPIGIAAAALYLACIHNNRHVSQRKIAEISGTTSVTLRCGYHHLVKKLQYMK